MTLKKLKKMKIEIILESWNNMEARINELELLVKELDKELGND